MTEVIEEPASSEPKEDLISILVRAKDDGVLRKDLDHGDMRPSA